MICLTKKKSVKNILSVLKLMACHRQETYHSMRKWPPLRFFVIAARDRHFPRIMVLGCFFNFFSEREAKFVARKMEQRESIEKRESLYEIIA